MVFNRLPKELISKSLKWCFVFGYRWVTITLIDGISLCGVISNLYIDIPFVNHKPDERDSILSGTITGDCSYTDGAVVLGDSLHFSTRVYFIPCDRIAGITAFYYAEEKLLYDQVKNEDYSKKEGYYYDDNGIIDNLIDDLFHKCLALGFMIHFNRVHELRVVGSQTFEWKGLYTLTEYPVYVDWEYLNNMSGGINSIGVGVSPLSGSISWEKSLYSFRKELMNKKILDISSISKSDVGAIVIDAYIDDIYVKNGKKNIVPYETMEGDKWFPVILSEEPIKDDSDLQRGKWCIGYLREKCMMLPKKVFQTTQSPFKIQGEIVPMYLRTPIGDSEFIFKVRNISSK